MTLLSSVKCAWLSEQVVSIQEDSFLRLVVRGALVVDCAECPARIYHNVATNEGRWFIVYY